MAIVAQYHVTPIGDDVSRKRIVYQSIRDENGKHVRFAAKVQEVKGGYFYKFPNGNSITLDKLADGEALKAMQDIEDLSDLEDGDEVPMEKRKARTQLEMFGLTDRPRLFDDMTGEEVDEQGRPLSLRQYISGGVPNDMPMEFQGRAKIEGEGVEASLKALEE